MFCGNCGTELKEEEQFCPNCGKPIERKKSSIENGNTSEKVHAFSLTKILIAVLLIFTIVFCFLGYKVLFGGKGGNTKEVVEVKETKEAGLLSSKKYLAVVTNSEQKYGYINDKGEEAIECQFDYARDFYDSGIAVVGKLVAEDTFNYGLIDTSGKMILDYSYVEIQDFSDNGLAVVVKEDGIGDDGYVEYKAGYINQKGEEVIPCQFSYAFAFSNGYAQVADENDYRGYINEKGKQVIPFSYWDATSFNKNGFALVRDELSEEYYCINTKGQVVFDNHAIYGNWISDDGLVAATEWGMDDEGESESSYYFVNENGEKAFDKEFADTSWFSNGLAAVSDSSNQWGYIDTKGEFVIPYKYDFAAMFNEDGYAVVGKMSYSEEDYDEEYYDEYKYGVVNQSGEEIITCKFGWIEYLGDGLWVCTNGGFDGNVALINSEEKVLVPYFQGKIEELGDNGWIAKGTCISRDYSEESETVYYQYSYLDKEGNKVLELPREYIYAGAFRKTK